MKLLIPLILFVCPCCVAQADKKDSVIIDPIERAPTFPGGIDSLKKFISSNLKYPYKRLDIEGIVYVEFIVNEDGSVSDSKVVKGLCTPCDKNAIEVVSKMPKWIPGKMFDKIVKMKMVYPVKYKSSD